MRKIAFALLALCGPAYAQTNIGQVDINPAVNAVTCSQATAANLKVDLSGTAANATAVKTDGSAVTQPVSGTVTCSGPLTDTQLRATAVPVSGTVTATATNLDVQIGGSDTVAVVGTGTAGTPAGNILTVQGVASMTKLLVTPDSVALPANQSVNVAQVAGATTSTAASGVQKVGIVGNAGAAVDAVEGAAPPANRLAVGGITSGATGGFIGGITVCTEQAVINTSTATTTLVITGVSGRHWRICSLNLVVGAAQGVAFITGTGATCGTSTAAVNGGTTGATGWQFAANGGLTQGSGIGEIMSSKVSGGATGDSLCIVTSTTAQTSGNVSYAIW